MKRKIKTPVPRKYILWNPSHSSPPRAVFHTLEAAKRSAEQMAERFAPDKFYVCELLEVAQVKPSPVKFTKVADEGLVPYNFFGEVPFG